MTKRIVPNVVRGGVALPLRGKTNYYYMSGRRHAQGGIDIGKNPRTGLEVEDGEVMHLTNNSVKVFSSVPFLNGKSPAQKVMGGENPTKVFKQQEEFKDRNNMNDDGTKKKRNGGLYSLTANGRTKLMMFPSTGKVSGKRDKYVLGGKNNKYTTVFDTKQFLKNNNLLGSLYPKYSLENHAPIQQTSNQVPNQIPEVVVTAPRINRISPLTPSTIPTLTTNRIEMPNNIYPLVKDTSITAPLPTPIIPTLKTNIVDIPDTYSRIYTYPKPSILDRAADIYGRVRDYTTNNPYVIGDGISLASNVISSIIGHRANSKMLDNIKYSSAPAMRRAAKLKTRININPQLDKMRESLAAYERDVNANTASSRVALARKQRARLANVMETNQLYADKENKETELINKDRLNQQSVADANIRDYNRWAQNKAAFDSAVLEKRAENDTALINNINAGIQDLITNRNKRDSEFRTLSALSLGSSPNLPAEMFYASGVWNKRMYDLYRKAYPLKGTKRGTDDSQNI